MVGSAISGCSALYVICNPEMHSKTVRANPDVVVIGGGPAGSTVSTLIAQRGYQVELFERDHFPRFHIGESLIPETYWVLKRLNMLPKMQQSHFVKKHSVRSEERRVGKECRARRGPYH